MKLKLILSAAVLCLATMPFAQDSLAVKPEAKPADVVMANPADSAFSKVYVSIEGGEMYPFGDLQDAVENAFSESYGEMLSLYGRDSEICNALRRILLGLKNNMRNG